MPLLFFICIILMFIDSDTTKVLFNETDPGFSYYTKNSRALRAKFIEGIAYFRRDLKIDPFVFEELSIHPEKFTLDVKRYMKHVSNMWLWRASSYSYA
ncbi:hypothetical protein M9991_08320 [Chryseobacterium gallinarum]|uniref:hypothetical protein n=1 Tax=Chryseobacterium gallinarum TaxID=1324352 RepID=UPI002025469E|nr:hypothetical protein [Chryseobacterium gallinarum]MCL8536873.1 hypothetical protein [Chryseobacterium gallinarum]